MKSNLKQLAIMAMMPLAGLTFSTNANAQANSNVRATGWFKTCNDQSDAKICSVQFRVVAGTGQIVTGISLIDVTGNGNRRRIFQIVVPTARSLPPGVEVRVDDKQGTAIPYSFCRPSFCVAEAALNDNLVKVFKAGGNLTVTSINFQGTNNAVPVTLKGFTAAFDGDPVKEEQPVANTEETEADKLKKQLEEKLKNNQN